MAPTPAQRSSLISAHQNLLADARSRLTDYATTMWSGLGSWRDSDVDRFVDRVAPRVLAGRKQVASWTDAYIAQIAGGKPGALIDTSSIRGASVHEVYRRPAATMYSKLAEGKPLDLAKAASVARVASLIATDLQMTQVRQAQRSMSGAGVEAFRRVLVGPGDCALCVIASTQRYWVEDLLPIHPGCVPGWAPVTARNVLAVSRRWYSGELVVLTTASGDEVTVTPNHPVLTERGWVPAHLVGVGDDLFHSRNRHGVVDGVPQEAHGPATAEDVWRAATMLGDLVRVPLAAEDFHADGSEGEVEIVSTNGNLAPIGDVTFGQPSGESALGGAHGGRILLPADGDFAALGFRVDSSASRLMGRGGLAGSLFGGHVGSSVEASVASAPRFDSPPEKFSLESSATYAKRGRDLIRRLSRVVERDRVVKLHRVSWSGHVFNLHTSEGWYASNSHIVSNCNCTVDSLGVGDHFDQVLDQGQLDMVHSQVAGATGTYDVGGRTPDYRKLIVVREHGEIGPLLTWKHQSFTGPADIG